VPDFQLSLPDRPAEGSTPDSATGNGYDVAVVGAGLAGLAVASLIARAGRSVIVLERGTVPGGFGRGLPDQTPPRDTGVLPLTDLGPAGPLAVLCERLGVPWSPPGMDPTLQVALPRHRLTFSHGMPGWWAELRREVPEDEPAWRGLLPDLIGLAHDRDALARTLPPLPVDGWWSRLRYRQAWLLRSLAPKTRDAAARLRRAARKPFRETLIAAGLGLISQQAIEACLWYLSLRSLDECSTLEAALALRRLAEGWAAAPGGLPDFVEGILRQLEADGGEVRPDTEVVGLLTEKGRVRGVRTARGETIAARWVVAALAPPLLAGLLPPRRWPAKGPLAHGWAPRVVPQCVTLIAPETHLSAELGDLCLIVPQAGRPAIEDNLVFLRVGEGPHPTERHLTIGRFVPPSLAAGPDTAGPLLRAVEQVAPGIGAVALRQAAYGAGELEALWGRPQAALRYTETGRDWLGRRGASHRLAWTGLLAVGDWTYPGRLPADVVEGALEAADCILAEW
jgi:glycine/D-amino acid oxidase-like deaminating enzyme